MYTLHYGNSRKPLAWIVPDEKYSKMFRIKLPDGSLSDMVNLSRAKDAAKTLVLPMAPSKDPRLFRWKHGYGASGAAQSDFQGDKV